MFLLIKCKLFIIRLILKINRIIFFCFHAKKWAIHCSWSRLFYLYSRYTNWNFHANKTQGWQKSRVGDYLENQFWNQQTILIRNIHGVLWVAELRFFFYLFINCNSGFSTVCKVQVCVCVCVYAWTYFWTVERKPSFLIAKICAFYLINWNLLL